MRVQRCDYCAGPTAVQVYAGDAFGIQACRAHEEAARRDCDADLHRRGRVRLRDARIALPELFNLFPSTCSVMRSNGTIDPGWHIPVNPFPTHYMGKVRGNHWSLLVEKDDEEVTKSVPLIDFLKPELQIPGLNSDVIDRCIAILEAGVYKEAADAQDRIGIMQGPDSDHPAIRAGINKEGVIGRIFECY